MAPARHGSVVDVVPFQLLLRGRILWLLWKCIQLTVFDLHRRVNPFYEIEEPQGVVILGSISWRKMVNDLVLDLQLQLTEVPSL